MSDDLNAILNKYGRKPDFATCTCPICHRSRVVDRRITTRQALHTIMGDALAESIISDMGPHWCMVAALVDPRGDGTSARAAIVEISRAGIDFHRDPDWRATPTPEPSK